MNDAIVWAGYATLLVAALLAPHLDPPRTQVVLVLALAVAIWTVVAVVQLS